MKKSKEQSEEIKEKYSNVKENVAFAFAFAWSEWTLRAYSDRLCTGLNAITYFFSNDDISSYLKAYTSEQFTFYLRNKLQH